MIGAVVIGRNEGQRLISCLDSLVKHIDYIIYVDSGSTDDSLHESESRNIECLSLDMSIPFTAARARNEGANYLIHKYSDLQFIQFIDGDCEIQPDWISKAQEFLEKHNQYAVVCGRRRERYPENSVYNQLCDIEWDTPVGDARACGGDALIRLEAFKQVVGYRDDLIAGEEPEMCFRLRAEGWKIYRLDAEMTLHDAAISKIFQWWKRTVRTGYAFSLGASIHYKSQEGYRVKEVCRIILWGILCPLFIAILSIYNFIYLNLFFIYLIQVIRVGVSRPDLDNIKFKWATSVVLGKVPEAVGLISFVRDVFCRRRARIIEYK